MASLIVDMKSFIRLFARIDRFINMAHFNNVYVCFSPGPTVRIFKRVRKNSESEWELPVTDPEWLSSETERYLWKYYFMASLIVDMKSFIRLFATINRKYGPI